MNSVFLLNLPVETRARANEVSVFCVASDPDPYIPRQHVLITTFHIMNYNKMTRLRSIQHQMKYHLQVCGIDDMKKYILHIDERFYFFFLRPPEKYLIFFSFLQLSL